ncbi:MAG TPA: hypothetical protein VFJ09_07190 [Nocardioidaceae bacterium]|nr:hypothetical protein [Nocardioidaceae bacterium]
MRVRVVSAVLVALMAVSGCSDVGDHQVTDLPSATGSGSSSRPSPTPGGKLPPPATPPSAPMDDLEQAVAARLGRQVAREQLDLQYVACPHWRGQAPRQLTCRGYVDGVTARIHVKLHRLTGGAVSFKARLGRGLIATSKLERQLRVDGFRAVDCGQAPAYPSVVGSHVVCAVTKNGDQRFVLATVTSRSGAVEIRGY